MDIVLQSFETILTSIARFDMPDGVVAALHSAEDVSAYPYRSLNDESSDRSFVESLVISVIF